MATTQITGLNPIGVVNDSDLILIHSGVEDFKGTITDLKSSNLDNTYLKITDNLSTVQDKPAAFNTIKQPATTTSSGVLEIATNAEAIDGVDSTVAIVPASLKAAMTDRDVLAGVGLTGGGNLGSDVTITLGTPSTITDTSTNGVTGTTHTHAIAAASTTAKGVIEIATSAETIAGSDTARAVVPSGLQAKLADIDIVAGNGLVTGGNLGSDVTLNMGTPSTITSTSTNSVTADSHTHAIDSATTITKGVVQLATNSDILLGSDNTKALTSYAYARAYDISDHTVSVGTSGANYTNLADAINHFKIRRRHFLQDTDYATYTITVNTSINDLLYITNEDLSWLKIFFNSVNFNGRVICNNATSPVIKGVVNDLGNGLTPLTATNNSKLLIDTLTINSGLCSTMIAADKNSGIKITESNISGGRSIGVLHNSELQLFNSDVNVNGSGGMYILYSSKLFASNSTISSTTLATTAGEAMVRVHRASECSINSCDLSRLTSSGNTIQVGGNDVGEGACIGRLVNSTFTYGAGSTSSQDVYCGQRSIITKDNCTGGTATAGTGVVY